MLAGLQHELAEHRHGPLGERRPARQTLLAESAGDVVGARAIFTMRSAPPQRAQAVTTCSAVE